MQIAYVSVFISVAIWSHRHALLHKVHYSGGFHVDDRAKQVNDHVCEFKQETENVNSGLFFRCFNKVTFRCFKHTNIECCVGKWHNGSKHLHCDYDSPAQSLARFCRQVAGFRKLSHIRAQLVDFIADHNSQIQLSKACESVDCSHAVCTVRVESGTVSTNKLLDAQKSHH